MQVNITKKTVQDMAKRLREQLPESKLGTAKSIDLVARVLGQANWDTLAAALKLEAKSPAQRFVLKQPVTLFIDAFCTDEYGDSPYWAEVTLSQALVDKILELSALNAAHGLNESRVDWGADRWGNEALRIRGEDLVVTHDHWWLHGLPKHCNYAVESRMISIESLLSVLQGKTDDCLQWRDGKLYYDGGGDIDGLVEQIAIGDGEAGETTNC